MKMNLDFKCQQSVRMRATTHSPGPPRERGQGHVGASCKFYTTNT